MGHIIDSRLEDIFHFRTTATVPREVCIPAHRMARLLIAARAFSTLSLFADPQAAADGGYTISVHKRWHIHFLWDGEFGARDLSLIRM